MDYQKFLVSTLKQSSKIANQNFGKVKGTNKPDNSVLTETDLEIGQKIIFEISKNFPDHNIIDEETGVINKNSQFTWVVDPIDGTSNFALGIPLYGTMIGLLKGKEPIAGGVVLPYFNEIIVAEKNKGCLYNDKKMSVSNETKLSNLMLAYSFDPIIGDEEFALRECTIMAKFMPHFRNIRSSNSVYDIVQVAKGKYGAYINRSSKIWDNVAPEVIIKEAGGMYTDFYGNSIDYSNPMNKVNENFTHCASSVFAFEKIRDITKKI